MAKRKKEKKEKNEDRFNQKLDFDTFEKIRDAVRLPIYKDLTIVDAATKLKLIHPEIIESSLRNYVGIARGTTDTLFEHLKQGDIGMYTLRVLALGDLDMATKDFLVEEFLNRKMTVKELETVKKMLLRDKLSVSEALKKATGEIPEFANPAGPKSVSRGFGNMIDDVVKTASLLRMKIDMAIELLPVTTLDKGEAHFQIFNKVYMLRHSLKEQYEYVDKKVKQYLDELVGYAVTEEQLRLKRKEISHGDLSSGVEGEKPENGEERGGGGPHAPRQAVQNRPRKGPRKG